MNRFMWLIRREIWEHKAIWVAPLIVLGCVVLTIFWTGMQIGPKLQFEAIAKLTGMSDDEIVGLVTIAYAMLTVVMLVVMGIISFFYSLDSLYADRRDRSVLFWKSLPLSDAETVLSKFTVACVAIPLVALVGAVLAQFLVAGVVSAKLALSGASAGLLWRPEAITGGIVIAALWCFIAIVWYAPVVGYLMLASAWAPRAPFLWAVLPPVGLAVLETILLYTDHVSQFIGVRLFGIMAVTDRSGEANPNPVTEQQVHDEMRKLAEFDLLGRLTDFLQTPQLWLGLIAAVALLAGAMWARRYRDENS